MNEQYWAAPQENMWAHISRGLMNLAEDLLVPDRRLRTRFREAHLAPSRSAEVPSSHENTRLDETDQPPNVQLEARFVVNREPTGLEGFASNSRNFQRTPSYV